MNLLLTQALWLKKVLEDGIIHVDRRRTLLSLVF
jgi:hypothetical protein